MPNTEAKSSPKATLLTLNDKKTKISDFGTNKASDLEWVVTVTGNETKNYTFNVSGTDNYLKIHNSEDSKGISVGTITGSENIFTWSATYNRLQGIGDKLVSFFSSDSYKDWRYYKTSNNNSTVTAFYKKITSDKKPAGIAYAEPSYTVNVGESYIKPELTNPNKLTPISYSIDCAPKGVATIDEEG
ncbi:MAG: hypothetical protein SPE53_07595, partial [Prevotella sp.]|nr:hypothetical protein [Prevotella sp.]